MTSKKKDTSYNDPIEGWVFWYESEEGMWKAAIREDFVKNANNPKMKVPALAASNLSDIMMFITTGLDDIN